MSLPVKLLFGFVRVLEGCVAPASARQELRELTAQLRDRIHRWNPFAGYLVLESSGRPFGADRGLGIALRNWATWGRPRAGDDGAVLRHLHRLIEAAYPNCGRLAGIKVELARHIEREGQRLGARSCVHYLERLDAQWKEMRRVEARRAAPPAPDASPLLGAPRPQARRPRRRILAPQEGGGAAMI
jgi:hypothetical protein